MRQFLPLIRRASAILLWLALTIAISFWVARSSTNTASNDLLSLPPQVELEERATVGLSEATIASVVSGDATVIQVGDQWMLEAPVSTDDLAYRLLDPPLGVKAMINGGPSGFECAWAGLAQQGQDSSLSESAMNLAPATTGVTMRCEIPSDVRVVAGLRGKIVLQMTKPVTVSSLPLSAVIGQQNTGQVIVLKDDGTAEARGVTLGVSDSTNIEIVSGLEADEVVLLFPTQSDFARTTADAP